MTVCAINHTHIQLCYW